MSNIPKLRFPEFNENWVNDKMRNLYSFKVTNSFSRENLNYEDGAVKNIHYGDIHTKFQTLFDITKESVPFINPDISIERIADENYCQEGDLILADASEDLTDVGKSIEVVNLNKEKVLSGLHTILARPTSEKLSIGFGGYLFKSNRVRTQIQKESQGSKVLSISTTRLSNISLVIPSIEEQQKIATFLTAVDSKLQSLKKKKSLLEEYKKGVMQRIFLSEKVSELGLVGLEDDRIENDEEENPSILQSKKSKFRQLRFKIPNEVGELVEPPDWEVKKLGEVADRITNKNKENNSNVLTISAQYGLISQLEFFNKSVSAKDVTGYYLLSENDFAYNKSYSTGYPMGALKRLKRYAKGVVSTLYICFRFKAGVDLDFMEHYFETGLLNVELEKVAQEGARNHGLLNIGVNDFFNIELNLPSFPEQTRIANFLSSIDEKINHCQKQIEQTEAWKKGLLQKLFV